MLWLTLLFNAFVNLFRIMWKPNTLHLCLRWCCPCSDFLWSTSHYYHWSEWSQYLKDGKKALWYKNKQYHMYNIQTKWEEGEGCMIHFYPSEDSMPRLVYRFTSVCHSQCYCFVIILLPIHEFSHNMQGKSNFSLEILIKEMNSW